MNSTKNVEPAGVIRNYLSYIIDGAVFYLFLRNIAVIEPRHFIVGSLSFLLFFLYYTFEGAFLNGQSVGKRICGIKCISVENRKIKIWQYIFRSIVLAWAFSPPIFTFTMSKTFNVIDLTLNTLIGLSMFLYPFFHPQKRSLLDILFGIALVKVDPRENQTIDWKGSVPMANWILIGMVPIVFIGALYFPSRNDEYAELENALAKENNRDVLIVLKKSTLQAIIYIGSYDDIDEILQFNYNKLQEFNKDPKVTHIQILLKHQVSRFIIFPVNNIIQGNVIDLKGFIPETQEMRIKYCNEKAHAYSCTNASMEFADNKNLDEAIAYSIKGCNLNDPLGCYNVACYKCRQSKKTEALEYFKKTVDSYFVDPKNRVGPSKPHTDPDLECLKDDQEFKMLLNHYLKKKLPN